MTTKALPRSVFKPNGVGGLFFSLLFSLLYLAWAFPQGFIAGTSSFWQMQNQDITQYVSGFTVFFSEPWHFPLLRIESINWPEGTLATFVDAIPFYALLLKLLVPSSFGPFNPYGFWIGICIILQGIGGWWTLREAQINRWPALFALLTLLLTMPVLQHRLGHVSLFSQWILIFGLALTLRGDRLGQASGGWVPLLVCGLYINIYLTAMAALLYLAELWCHRYRPTPLRWLLWPLLAVLIAAGTIPLLMWPLPGHHLARDGGFGLYSMNLLAPLTGSRFFNFSNPVVNDAQAVEGYNYLGAGIIVLAIGLWLTRGRYRDLASKPRPVLTQPQAFAVVLLIATFYALSNKITLGSAVLLEWMVPDFANGLTGQFRASGRFFWLVVYTLSIFGVIALCRRLTGWRLLIALSVIVLIQIADRLPAIHTQQGLAAPPSSFVLNQPAWRDALGRESQTIYFYPKLRCAKNSNIYETLLPVMRYAAEHQIKLTTGYIARYSPDCDAMSIEARTSNPVGGAYVFVNSEYTEDQIKDMLPDAPNLHCVVVDFATVCRAPYRD